MPHIPERLLGLYALDPGVVPIRAEIEQHVAVCSGCRVMLDEIRAFDAVLADPDRWPEEEAEPHDEGIAQLRRFAAQLAREDDEAAALLSQFDGAPAARFVWDDLPSKREYLTAGVVRALCSRANGMCEREPLYALVLAEAATDIADMLNDAEYPRRTVHQWRGDAWKEQANALRFLGRLSDTLAALAKAEEEYSELPDGALSMMALDYVRATVLFEQDQFASARLLAQRSANTAERLGDTERVMRARHLQGEILFEEAAYDAASEVFRRLLEFGEQQKDLIWIARESLTLGSCHLELRELHLARRHLDRALALYTSLQFPAEVTRTKWALGRVDVCEGRTRIGIEGLRSCISAFSRLGMLSDAGLVAIDLAEVLHASDRTAEIPAVLTAVVKTFTAAGKVTSALTAFAYLRTAAASRTLTPAAVSHVRRFVARADRQPELLFVPPSSGAL